MMDFPIRSRDRGDKAASRSSVRARGHRSAFAGCLRHGQVVSCLAAAALAGASSACAAVPSAVSPSPATASDPSPVDAAATRLVLLGTAGGPVIRQRRLQPANLLVVRGRVYLIDVGAGSLRNLARAGFQAQDVDAVFITHHHLDHDGGLGDLIAFSSFGRRSREVAIVGPAGTAGMVAAAIDLSKVSRRIFGSEGLVPAPDPVGIYKARDIAAERLVYEDANVKVTAAENSHFRLRPGTPSYGVDRSYSYRFETPDGVIVFTGDTGPSDSVASLAEDADVLVSEVIDVPGAIAFASKFMSTTPGSLEKIAEHMRAEHLPSEDLGKLAKKARVKSLILTHFAPGGDAETTVEQYTAGIRRNYPGPLFAGRDMMEFNVAPSNTSSPVSVHNLGDSLK